MFKELHTKARHQAAEAEFIQTFFLAVIVKVCRFDDNHPVDLLTQEFDKTGNVCIFRKPQIKIGSDMKICEVVDQR